MTTASAFPSTNKDVGAYLGHAAGRGNPEARKLDSYPHLDWLRFVLASIVFLDHASCPLPPPISGGLAVAVFLALSGWLIGGILMRSDRGDLPRFFFNRSTRIWAPYVATVVLLYAVAALREGVSANWLKYLFYDATFTHITWVHFPRAAAELPLKGTGNHFWSIAVEEQFYLVAPAIMLLARWGKHPVTWVAITALLIADQSIFAPIGAGVCAAAINARRPIGTTAAERWIAAAVAVVAALLLMTRWRHEVFVALFSVAVILALVAPGRRTSIAVFFGGISYPFYLNHWIALISMNVLMKRVAAMPYTVALALGYAGAVAVATAAWWIIDRNVLTHRNNWYTPARGRVCAVLAYLLVAVGLAGGYLLQSRGY
jgi:peptidoglycan/LPS O-acetylase OafA/YrhL